MDSAAAAQALEESYRLLALCARAEHHPLFQDQLREQLGSFSAWDVLPAEAERHGMGALLWHHIRTAQVIIPAPVEKTLKALYLRQRIVNEIRVQVLCDVYAALEERGIMPILLKGLGLAFPYYPDPALRAVGDIDLLLRQSEMPQALDALAAADFHVHQPAASEAREMPEELTATSPSRGGLRTRIELHHYGDGRRSLMGDPRREELLGLDASPQALHIGACAARVPAPLDTLRYLLLHLQRHLIEASEERPLPLKWIADIVSLVERHATEWDWEQVQRQHPGLLQRLDVFYSLTPLPEHLEGVVPVGHSRPPAGPNRYPRGWPGHTHRGRRLRDRLRLFMATFEIPSPWWLRLYNGIGEGACWWYGAVVHPLQVLHLAVRARIRRTRQAQGAPKR